MASIYHRFRPKTYLKRPERGSTWPILRFTNWATITPQRNRFANFAAEEEQTQLQTLHLVIIFAHEPFDQWRGNFVSIVFVASPNRWVQHNVRTYQPRIRTANNLLRGFLMNHAGRKSHIDPVLLYKLNGPEPGSTAKCDVRLAVHRQSGYGGWTRGP